MNTTIITTQGDRWELIAYRAYGDITRMGDIIRANPRLPLYTVFPPGITVNIPVISKPAIDKSKLPVWRR